MARMIDADVAIKRFRGWLEGPHEATVYNSGFDDAIWRVLDAIEHIPTLTPPNEPLTWSELAEMKGQPVYIVEMGARRYWALVTYVGKDTAEFVTADDPDDYGDKELYGESWVAYRRPPEGKEGTK